MSYFDGFAFQPNQLWRIWCGPCFDGFWYGDVASTEHHRYSEPKLLCMGCRWAPVWPRGYFSQRYFVHEGRDSINFCCSNSQQKVRLWNCDRNFTTEKKHKKKKTRTMSIALVLDVRYAANPKQGLPLCENGWAICNWRGSQFITFFFGPADGFTCT